MSRARALARFGAVPIVPDDKDWTWVSERACPQCGFDPAALTHEELPVRIDRSSTAWAQILRGRDLGARPDDSTWSPLEYACHVRDVHRVYVGRLRRMLEEDDPHYANWDQDATAVEERYGEQIPEVVAAELRAAADEIGGLFRSVSGDQWDRTGRRSDGAAFTVDSIGRYYLHDIEHHIWDVTGSLP